MGSGLTGRGGAVAVQHFVAMLVRAIAKTEEPAQPMHLVTSLKLKQFPTNRSLRTP